MLSDHGWHLGTKRHWSKMTLWEEANHIPFIIKAPGIKPAKCRQPVDLLSIFSTVLELAELPAPNEVNPEHQILDSQSLVPLLNKPDEGPDRTVVFSYNYSFRLRAFAAVNKRWKLIHYSHTGEEELYDLKNDPFELKNIIRNQSTASSLARRGYRSLRETIKAETINSARGLQALNPNTPVAFTTIADDTDRP